MMILRRLAAVLFLGLLGAAVVYSLMMAFGDPALELLLCAAWMPLYLVAYSTGLARIRPSA
ncbi:MAG TPA: hypothetical protein VIR16_01515 [Candidatus Limnocylindrales bacterium]